ncbi:MAG: chemotaxis protein CheX [Brevinematales bacterium]|nr:chemotaxis protein CheX [Brevinematales bacterium]
MRFEIINPFIDAFVSVCKKLNIEIHKDKVNLKTGKKIEKDISFFFKIKGDFKGNVIYEMDERLAIEVVKRIYQIDEIPKDKELMLSGVGEFGNIVNSQLLEITYKRKLDYSISHPMFYKYKGKVISYSSPCVEVLFITHYGEVILSVVFDKVLSV